MSQVLPLREQLNALESLQGIDLKIDALKKKRDALPASRKALEDALNKARLALDAKTGAITEFEKLDRQAQAAMDLNKDRVSRSNSKLEKVGNTQEFQAASRELEQLRKQALQLEEQIKKGRVEIESAQKDAGRLDEELAKVRSAHEAQAAELNSQLGKLESQISELMAERGKFTGGVEPRILAQYDRVRGARGGIGIVQASGGRCSGCNMMVPPQLYNEIQKGSQIHQCPSCHRFLFVPVAGVQAPQPPLASAG